MSRTVYSIGEALRLLEPESIKSEERRAAFRHALQTRARTIRAITSGGVSA